MTATAAIVVNDLSKAYGAHQAVRGLTFSVRRGEVYGLLGPNGAGKTTTVEILEGHRRRDGGEVTVLGHHARDLGDLLGRNHRPGADAREGALLEHLGEAPAVHLGDEHAGRVRADVDAGTAHEGAREDAMMAA